MMWTRKLRWVLLCALGLCALGASAVFASGASASEYNLKMLPEVGRCKFVGVGHGEFRGKKCTLSEPATGGSTWFSGLGAKKGFTATVKAPIQFGTHNLTTTVNCASGEAQGEYTSPKTVTVTNLVFHGCASGEGQCENEIGSTLGEISTQELEGELGFITHPKKLKIGWDLKPASGSNLAKFECDATAALGKSAGGGIPRELQGSVIGRVLQLNHMLSEYTISFQLVKGLQQYEKFEGHPKDTLVTQLGEKPPLMGKTPVATTFEATALVKDEEQLEVLGKCKGAGC
jgi:hypothetical protein